MSEHFNPHPSPAAHDQPIDDQSLVIPARTAAPVEQFTDLPDEAISFSSEPHPDTVIPTTTAPVQPAPTAAPTEEREKGNAGKNEAYAFIPDSLVSGDPYNVTVDRPMVSNKETPAVENLDMPSADVVRNTDVMARFPNMAKEAPEADALWLNSFIDGLRMVVANAQYQSSLSREDADWRQGLYDGGNVIRSMIPRFERPRGVSLSGDAALQNAVSYMGLGDVFMAAMWNSGFWVTFTPAPEVAWVELNRILASEEIQLGRSTYGLAHSGSTSLTQRTIVDFILKYVYATSVKATEMPVSEIPKYLKAHDVNAFIWGFIAANFPHGFSTDRSCVVNPSICKEVTTETLEVTELQVVDNKAIDDPSLRAHMRKRQQGSMTLQSVIEYQERLAANSPRTFEVKGGSQKSISVTLSVPSAMKEFERGQAHVDYVTQAVQRTVTSDTSFRERQRMLNEFFTATEMCIYQHWVEKIEFNENDVPKETDIQNLLAVFTKDAVMRASFLEVIKTYIDQSVVSLIALTPLVCPKCGGVHSRKSDLRPELQDVIPFDVVHVFSILAEFKTGMIRARAASATA